MTSSQIGIGVVVLVLLTRGMWAQPSAEELLHREKSLVWQDSVAAVAPLEALRSASWFEAAGVGISGRMPATVRAWLGIARGKAPATVFASLLHSDSAAARLYGLTGLYVFDRRAFRKAASRERARTDSVMTFIGCIVSVKPTAALVREIATGSWSREYLSRAQFASQ